MSYQGGGMLKSGEEEIGGGAAVKLSHKQRKHFYLKNIGFAFN